MNALPRCAWLLLLFCASAGATGWERIVAGVDYRHLQRDGLDAHVVRIDLHVRSLEVVATKTAERGLTVSDFARGRGAVVAINGDYFDTSLNPFGLAMGDGTVWWQAAAGVRRQEVLGVGPGRARIFPRDAPLREPKRWMTGAVAGWPLVVENCSPVTSLPGSPQFTLAPHPRTAVGLSKDRRGLLLLVADGRREGMPGLTLPELAALLVEVGACTALNLDGGGSSALWLRDRIVNRPSDGFERKVANHLGVVEVRRKR
jgi:exopolysaccharide biosynthesis protein